MKRYLLSIYQPDAPSPPPEVLEKVMGEIDTLIKELKAASSWLIIEAPDLDSALEWGRRAAQATSLPIEVRPFQDEPAD